MSEEVVFKEAPAAVTEAAPKGEEDATPSTEAAVKVVLPHLARASTRWLSLLVLAFIVFLVVPTYLHKHRAEIRDAVRSPVSVLIPFGFRVDTHDLIRQLNPDRQQVYMDDVHKGAVSLGKGNQTVVTFKTEEGTEREAVLYVPESYNPQPWNRVAMMVLFHGLNDNCKHFLDATGFVPYADRDGFVIASVCGSLGYLGTAWNSGTCCGFSGDKPNDVGLAKQVVREVSQTYAIDADRVMAVGFSNGAMLAEVLACDAPDVFRAAASIGGVVELRPGNADGLAKCTAAVQNAGTPSRTSVLMVHGTADVMVPWGGSKLLGFPSVTDNVQGWSERNGCAGEPTTTISTPKYTNTLYQTCRGGDGPAGPPPGVEVCPEGTDYTPPTANGASPRGNPSPNVSRTDLEESLTQRDLHRHVSVQSVRQALLKELKVTDDEVMDGDDHKRGHKGWRHKREKKHKKHDDDEVEEDTREAGEEGERADREDHHDHHGRRTREHRGHGFKHGHKGGHRHGDRHGNHSHVHDRKHRGHKHGASPSPAPKRPLVAPATGYVIRRYADGASQVELVQVKDGGHSWPQDKEFSTTDYIYLFGGRVFGRYN